jgi:predicted glycosyl hydrolase (DUF1957 family)
MWAIVVAHTSMDFFGFTMWGAGPLFMQDVLKFDIKKASTSVLQLMTYAHINKDKFLSVDYCGI